MYVQSLLQDVVAAETEIAMCSRVNHFSHRVSTVILVETTSIISDVALSGGATTFVVLRTCEVVLIDS